MVSDDNNNVSSSSPAVHVVHLNGWKEEPGMFAYFQNSLTFICTKLKWKNYVSPFPNCFGRD